MLSNFRFPTMITFGAGASQKLCSELQGFNCHRPLFVTDKGLASSATVARLLKDLEENDFKAKVFSKAHGNPTVSQALEGVDVYKNHKADSVVMLGGGCALDVGKAIALMAKHPGNLLDYEDEKPGGREVQAHLVPHMVAIPTTAGTGSEVGGSSVLSHDETHNKIIIWGHALVPHKVLADPLLTVSLPPNLTAATGMDALTHNIEAYLTNNFHPMCDGIALEGIRLAKEHLIRAYKEPDDIEARGGMLMSSMMGAIAFQKGLGVTHSCAHALSTCYDLHHGLANAVMLEACMNFNKSSVPEKLVNIGKLLGYNGSQNEQIEGFFSWLKELKKELQIPDSLAELNIKLTDKLINTAFKDVCHSNNPRLCKLTDFKELFINGGAS